MLASTSMFALSILLFSCCILESGVAGMDLAELVQKVERWIRYSIHHGERYSYRFSSPMNDTPAEPKLDTKNVVIADFNNAQCLTETRGYWFCKAASNSVHTVVQYIEVCQAMIMKDVWTWDGNETAQTPKWLQTARIIRNTLGWNHFTLYYGAIDAAAPYEYESYRRKFYPAKAAEWLPEKKFEKFCAKTETPWRMLMDAGIKMLTYNDVHNRLKAMAECGKNASKLMFHIVLYQALLWELRKTPGAEWTGTPGASSSSAAVATDYQKANSTDVDDPMMRRDYIVYWLSTVLTELKKRFDKQRQEFQAKTQEYESDSWPAQTVIKIWAKYGPHWAEMVKSVEKMGIKGLDESYNMFDEPKKEGQTYRTKAN